MIEGRVPATVHTFVFGASLVGLEKKSGEVHPIDVSFTLHTLVAKIAGQMIWLNYSVPDS